MQRTQSDRTARRSRCMGWLLATVLLAPGLGGCAMRSGPRLSYLLVSTILLPFSVRGKKRCF